MSGDLHIEPIAKETARVNAHRIIVTATIVGALCATATAYAELQPSVQGTVAPAAADKGSGMAIMNALVNADGVLVRGVGATSAFKGNPGIFVIGFDRVVTDCGHVASLSVIGLNDPYPNGSATVGGVGGLPNALSVFTRDENGVAAYRSFQILVFCGK